MNKNLLFTLLGIILSTYSFGQPPNYFPVNGTVQNNHLVHAFTNATIYISPDLKQENSTLLIKDGKIISSGQNTTIPEGAVIHDLSGKYIFPSFIDLHSNYGVPKTQPNSSSTKKGPQIKSSKKGAYGWNEAIRSEVTSTHYFSPSIKEADKLRELGFGTILSHIPDGISRGSGTLVSLHNDAHQAVILPIASTHYSFQKGSSPQNYPSSLMGAISLLKQTYLDAEWYSHQDTGKFINLTLEAFKRQESLPVFFDADNYLNVIRADKLGDEFRQQYIFKTRGDSYKRIESIVKTGASLIVPLRLPKAYDVSDPYDALNVTMESMKHWETAPFNLSILEQNKISFALTTSDLSDSKLFWKNLRKCIENGLSEKTAFAALTTIPAKMIGAEKFLGTLEVGKIANFFISSENPFEKDFVLYQNWNRGTNYQYQATDITDIRGNYDLSVNGVIFDLKVEGTSLKPTATIAQKDSSKTKIQLTLNLDALSMHFDLKDSLHPGIIRLMGKVNYDSGSWNGRGQVSDGSWIDWAAIRNSKYSPKKEKSKEKKELKTPVITYPNIAFGNAEIPQRRSVLIKNATIWTNEEEGILKQTDLLLQNGKIKHIGKILDVVDPNVWVIDAKGKHVTAGIVDEHSHIGISRGVNEGSQASSAEVNIGDVVNPDDVNIYRQLSGGVTTAQLLHGSANPIGGQSALIKFKWGETAEEMLIQEADGYIKFALGENVKQSNWGDYYQVRFPQSRMGVEQVFYDHFYRARQYDKEWKAYNDLDEKTKEKTQLPRRDLELETLAEILNRERFITCHSYVQSEINMLMHVADSMGFTINTFTHILEGYKVANKMKEHGAGGSTFSDWWAYKFEVNDAIPYNGAILHNQGITVAFNSDDPEMGRRLNQEAAKAVKYGGISEEEALKFVTLNPAKLLHLDDRIGSIKIGKDADVVIWSGNPLSIYSKAEKTFVEGTCYYDLEKEAEITSRIQQERNRLINKMLGAKKAGEATQKPSKKAEHHNHCDTIEDYK